MARSISIPQSIKRYRTSPCKNNYHDWCGGTKGSAKTIHKCECWCHSNAAQYRQWVKESIKNGVTIRDRNGKVKN